MPLSVFVAVAALFVLSGISYAFARKFPKGAKMPMQWGLDGKPTWTASVPLGVSFTLVIATVVLGLTAGISFIAGDVQLLVYVVAFQAAVFLVVHTLHLMCALRNVSQQAAS